MKNPRIKPKNRKNWSLILRRTTQTGFVVFILVASIRHSLGGENSAAASIDALCPFGGLETLWRMLVDGQYVPKTHISNLILGIGLLIGALVAGAAFCGWICPFGSLQDFLTTIRRRLHIREVHVSENIDRWLRYGRFVILALILIKTIELVKLWFADFDPYRTIFSLGWIFEPNLAENWPAYLVAVLVILSSFLIPRAWCKYACPLGGALSLISHLSPLRIRRVEEHCKSCTICEAPCPVGLKIADANPYISTNCIGCLECVEACPRNGALEVHLSPAWWPVHAQSINTVTEETLS